MIKHTNNDWDKQAFHHGVDRVAASNKRRRSKRSHFFFLSSHEIVRASEIDSIETRNIISMYNDGLDQCWFAYALLLYQVFSNRQLAAIRYITAYVYKDKKKNTKQEYVSQLSWQRKASSARLLLGYSTTHDA